MDRSHPVPTELDVRALEVRRTGFHVAWQGYRKEDVDAFLDDAVDTMRERIQVNASLRAGLPTPEPQRDTDGVTPFDVQAKRFEMAHLGRGYRMREVDECLDDVTDMLSQLESENEALRAERPSD
jgi:DivIVA domain-containing protein